MQWKRPTGSLIETNNEKSTIEHCESMGWKRVEETQEEVKAAPKKRGRPKKVEPESDGD